ncbi:MAG TPA: nucleotide exchange factor GrpE [Phycisphaerae bacterium]|nr:nucleotide exchange factor GrpE [Phycisphaerae bacterium]
MSTKKNKKNVAIADGNDDADVQSNDDAVLDTGAVDAVDDAETVESADPIEQLQAEVAEWKDKFLRSKAEQQNIARRSSNEISEALRYAGTGLLKSVIEVMDDLDRTVEAVAGAGDGGAPADSTLADGVRLVRDKLQKILTDNHVEIIDATDAPFDPMQHEALMQQPTPDHEPGRVIQQIQKGYKLHDRVLRPAKVIVSAAVNQGDDTDA